MSSTAFFSPTGSPGTCSSADSAVLETASQTLNPAQAETEDTWQRLFLFAAILGCCVGISMDIADPDLWGHVQYGRDALANGLPSKATYTYSAPDHVWVNHENIAEWAFAAVDAWSGGKGLMAFKLLLGVPVVLTLFRLARRQRASLMVQVVLIVLVSMNLTYGWAVRPQLFTYFCFFLMILLLDWCFRKGAFSTTFGPDANVMRPAARLRWLWLSAPLFVFWANSHGGFVAGLCVLWAYLGGRSLERLASEGKAAWRFAAMMGAIAATATLASLVNPYGIHYWTFIHDAVTLPRVEITEWHGMTLDFDLLIPFSVLTLLTILSVAFTNRRRDWVQLAILALLAWQSISHTRHVVFFALAAGFWIPGYLETAYQRLREIMEKHAIATDPRHAAGPGKLLDVCLMLALVLLIGKLALRLDQLKVNRKEYPVAAFQFMADHGLEGKMVVTFNWAQYAIAAFGPRGSTVQFDGRFETCYPPAIAASHFDFILGDAPGKRYRAPGVPPFDDTRALRDGEPDLAVIDRGSHAVEVMKTQTADWVMLYQDGLAQIWGRRAKYDDPESPSYLPPVVRLITDEPQQGFVNWPALPEFPRTNPTAVAQSNSNQIAAVTP